MTRQDYIEAIRKGEYAIENDDTESLKKLLKEIFPRDKEAAGDRLFYTSYFSVQDTWLGHKTQPKELKSIKATELMNMKTGEIKITPEQAQRIIDAACSTWTSRLCSIWAYSIVLKETITVTEQFYQEMRSACTPAQHTLFDEIFGMDKPEFKVGDFVFDLNHLGVIEIDTFNGDSFAGYSWFEGVKHSDMIESSANKARHATEAEIRKAQFYPDGTPCWVRPHGGAEWSLRYADGNGRFYTDQKKTGDVTTWSESKPFDPNNLPFNE